MLIRVFLIVFVSMLPARSQDLQGNDTAGNWRVRHFQSFGIWNSICDERPENGILRQRCYIRYVDVFSPRPDFAAQFLFIHLHQGHEIAEFGIEPGTLFAANGFRIEAGDHILWQTRRPGCLSGLSCRFNQTQAPALLMAMQSGTVMRFVFRDRHGQPRDLRWPLAGFTSALADFRNQSRARGLLR